MKIADVYRRCTLTCEGCRIWNGSITRDGRYPAIYVPGDRIRLGHRVVWSNKHGPIPAGIQIIRTCRNSLCLERSHMAAMTKAQSSAFAAAGGSYKTLRHHTANIVNNRRNAKLNLDKVREIRSLVNDGATYRSIAKTYGVNETSVGKIARGTLWAPMAAPNSSVFAMVA